MQIIEGVRTRSFRAANGENEHFITVAAPGGASFREQIDEVQRRYLEAQSALGLNPNTAVFRRIFLSDALNQATIARESALGGSEQDPVAVSIIQQMPLPGTKLALFAYHVESRGGMTKRRLSGHHLILEKGRLRHLWSTGLCAGAESSSLSEAGQTHRMFDGLIGTLAAQGGTLLDNCVRTWIYLKDVDVFYPGMVKSRRDLFAEQGLTGDTHFIASTGIQGACAHRCDLVAMDAYSILGVQPEQISYLNDFDRLCATKDYNVTFERGTRVAYSDRSHLFISGTASIDRAGRIMHEGDVLRQLDHALDNVDALLRAGSTSLADGMMYLFVYLRDPTDAAVVERRLADRLPDLPILIVQGAVCRPGWLVEVEGIAITDQGAPNLPAF